MAILDQAPFVLHGCKSQRQQHPDYAAKIGTDKVPHIYNLIWTSFQLCCGVAMHEGMGIASHI